MGRINTTSPPPYLNALLGGDFEGGTSLGLVKSSVALSGPPLAPNLSVNVASMVKDVELRIHADKDNIVLFQTYRVKREDIRALLPLGQDLPAIMHVLSPELYAECKKQILHHELLSYPDRMAMGIHLDTAFNQEPYFIGHNKPEFQNCLQKLHLAAPQALPTQLAASSSSAVLPFPTETPTTVNSEEHPLLAPVLALATTKKSTSVVWQNFKNASVARKAVACFLFILAAITIPILILNLALVAVLYFVLSAISSIKQKEKRLETFGKKVKWFWKISKKCVLRSFTIAKKPLDVNCPWSEIRTDVLNLTLDFNGELRNSFSVCNAVHGISDMALGYVLGPLRVFQGMLICALTTCNLVDAHRDLKTVITEAEKAKIWADIKTNLLYLAQGLLWITLGALVIISTVYGGPALMLAVAIITLILFDISFISVSGGWMNQARIFNKHYLQPFEQKLGEVSTAFNASNPTIAQILPLLECLYGLGCNTAWDAFNDKEGQIRERFLKRIISEENIEELKRIIREIQDKTLTLNENGKTRIQALLVAMQMALEQKKVKNSLNNYSAVAQIGLTLTGTAFDIKTVADPTYGAGLWVNAGSAASWIQNNTQSKGAFGDNGQIAEAISENSACAKDFLRANVLMSFIVSLGGIGGGLGTGEISPIFGSHF